MNTNTILLMFAVIAAFGLITATLVAPVVHEANARLFRALPPQAACHESSDVGTCARGEHGPPRD